MSELWPDALFASDGTEPSAPVRDRSGEGREDAPMFPSLPLPPIPPLRMTREEIAAALREDSGALAGHDPVAMPASPPTTPEPRAAAPSQTPQTGVTATQPVPPAAQPAGPRSASGTPRLTRPVISAAPVPNQGLSRGFSPLRYARRVVPGGTRPLGQRRDSRRRAGGRNRGLQTRTRSDGGASAFFTIMLITFAVLLYFIVSGLVAAFARLIP
ncbi:MAG TPA: hypothetical protein VF788_14180 [Pseudonocardiaceae bacterium]